MRILAACASALALVGTAALADDACKFCASEVVVNASQLDCLKQRVDQAAREIGDKNTALIDLLSCGQASGTPQSGVSPQAPAPVAGAPQTGGPVQVYRLTRSGLACIQRRLGTPPAGPDPIRLSTTCA